MLKVFLSEAGDLDAFVSIVNGWKKIYIANIGKLGTADFNCSKGACIVHHHIFSS